MSCFTFQCTKTFVVPNKLITLSLICKFFKKLFRPMGAWQCGTAYDVPDSKPTNSVQLHSEITYERQM